MLPTERPFLQMFEKATLNEGNTETPEQALKYNRT